MWKTDGSTLLKLKEAAKTIFVGGTSCSCPLLNTCLQMRSKGKPCQARRLNP